MELIEVSGESVRKAKERAEIQVKIDLCLKWDVCPECAEDLEWERSTSLGTEHTKYECSSDKCKFMHKTDIHLPSLYTR